MRSLLLQLLYLRHMCVFHHGGQLLKGTPAQLALKLDIPEIVLRRLLEVRCTCVFCDIFSLFSCQAHCRCMSFSFIVRLPGFSHPLLLTKPACCALVCGSTFTTQKKPVQQNISTKSHFRHSPSWRQAGHATFFERGAERC